MLGLREQVSGDPFGVVLRIGDHCDLRRAGDGIDADIAKDDALGRRYVGVARADDLVDRPQLPCPIGERRYRLGAANRVELGDAGAQGGVGDGRVHLAARHRGRHHQSLDARRPRRDCVHQDRAWIARATAGDIKTDGVDRGPAPAQFKAGRVGEAMVLGALVGVIGFDSDRGEIQRFAHRTRASLRGVAKIDAFGGQGVRVEGDAIEAARVGRHRNPAMAADIADDRGGGGEDVLRGFRAAQLEEGLEIERELG